MRIGYGINRRHSDFAKAKLDRDGFKQLRVWIDVDAKVRPEFSLMLLSLRQGDVVVVLAMSDLGQGGFGQGEAIRKIEARGATLELAETGTPPPAPRKRGPKPKWGGIPADVVKRGAERWHNPDIYTPHAALKVFHDAGFEWVTRAILNSNIGVRSKPLPLNDKEGE